MIIFPIFGFILGTILGSLAKALADRSLKNASYMGRSKCPSCQHKLSWYDLIPLFSYLSLKGKCRYCHKKISIEYFLIEVVTGILVAFIFWQSSINLENLNFNLQAVTIIPAVFTILFKTFFTTILVILFMTDIKDTFIPDRITYPAIIIVSVALLLDTLFRIWYLYFGLSQSAFGKYLLPPHTSYFTNHAWDIFQNYLFHLGAGILIGGFFLMLIIITRGKGMGGGDVKLGAFIGLVLGFPLGILAIMLSFITGAIYAVFLIFLGKKKFGENIAFGPFLVLGSLIVLFWGNQIINWYVKLTG